MKRKNQLSSFDIMVLAKELKTLLMGGFIDKIYQHSKTEVIIRVTVPRKRLENYKESESGNESPKYLHYNVIIEVGKFLFAVDRNNYTDSSGSIASMSDHNQRTNQPGSFAMLLRKHLKNGRIDDLYQYEFERILIINIAKRDNYQLIIELFGDGNILLINDNKIVQPLFSRTWSARTLRAGEDYKFPPERINPKKLNMSTFNYTLQNTNKDLVRALIMELDIPGKFSEEICHRAKIEKNVKAAQLDDDQLELIFRLTLQLFEEIEDNYCPYLVFESEDDTEPFEVMPTKLGIFNDYNFKQLNDYNTAVQEFFRPTGNLDFVKTRKEQKAHQELEQKKEFVSSEEARIKRQLEQQNAAIEKFTADIELNHEFGETIYSNYQRCEEILTEVNALRQDSEIDDVLENMNNKEDIVELNINRGYVILQLAKMDNTGKLDIKLNLRKNVIENANFFYERSKSAKEKFRGAEKALEKSKLALEILLKKQTDLDRTKIPKQKPTLGRHFWFEKYHWMITSDGNIVVAGRDAKSNDQVVKKHLNDKDRYCHADLTGAPSVVVKHDPQINAGEISDDSLEEACKFALVFSKAWSAKHGAGTAYWVKPDQVSKTPQSGEYLARGAFVVRGKRNYIGNMKLELAVGDLKYDGRQKLIAGPVSTVRNHCKQFVLLVPGEIKKNSMAKELSGLFNVSIDDLLSVLPAGGFQLIEKVGFNSSTL